MEINIIYIIIPVLFFIIGFLVVYLIRIALIRPDTIQSSQLNHYNSNNYNEKGLEFEIIDALLSKYNEKIEILEQKIAEQKIQFDKLELFLKSHLPQEKSPVIMKFSDKSPEIDNITNHNDTTGIKIPNNINYKKNEEIGTNTITNVLNILKEESKSSNEIKNAIGRTREHTARLMKRLTEMQLVERQSDLKPFKYRISNIGRKYLEKEIGLLDNNLTI